MSKYVENWWVEELPNGVIKLIINCTQREIYFHQLNNYEFIIAGTEEEYDNWNESVLFSVSNFLPPIDGLYLNTSMKEKDQLYFFYIPHLREWRKNKKNITKKYIMFEIEYLNIVNSVLANISLEDFNSWKYIDCFGNFSREIQYREDLERELLKLERYDLLINLRDSV